MQLVQQNVLLTLTLTLKFHSRAISRFFSISPRRAKNAFLLYIISLRFIYFSVLLHVFFFVRTSYVWLCLFPELRSEMKPGLCMYYTAQSRS